MTQSNVNIPNHNHHGLLHVSKEGYDSGFNGQAWVSLKMTNNLVAGTFTAVFETFSAISPLNQLNNETLLQHVNGHGGYSIITFSHDYQTTDSKAFIQFNSNGQPGEITLQIRYYGSSYFKSELYFLLAGRQSSAFNHALFDVDDVVNKEQILYFEDLNLNGNKIRGLAEPVNNDESANKDYVDSTSIKSLDLI